MKNACILLRDLFSETALATRPGIPWDRRYVNGRSFKKGLCTGVKILRQLKLKSTIFISYHVFLNKLNTFFEECKFENNTSQCFLLWSRRCIPLFSLHAAARVILATQGILSFIFFFLWLIGILHVHSRHEILQWNILCFSTFSNA